MVSILILSHTTWIFVQQGLQMKQLLSKAQSMVQLVEQCYFDHLIVQLFFPYTYNNQVIDTFLKIRIDNYLIISFTRNVQKLFRARQVNNNRKKVLD